MKTFEMTTLSHPQSGKEVQGISILGRTFVYSDSRGYGMKAKIDVEFALNIIKEFGTIKGRTGLPIYYPERCYDNDIQLSWCRYTNNSFELKIHSHSQHVWTSERINLN